MAYSEEDLQKYLKKAQEVLNSKTENHLSAEDLNDIAQNLGLNIKEIAQAREDYLTRGNTHLKFNNLDEATQEFEQLLLLSPNHPEGLIGLAQAHLEKWQQNHKKADKEKALEYANQCIDIVPDLNQAYVIISELRQKPKAAKKAKTKPSIQKQTLVQSRTKNTSRNKAKRTSKDKLINLLLIVGILVFVGAYQLFSHFYKSTKTSGLRVGNTSQGLVLWQVKTKRYKKYPYHRQPVLQIAQATTGELLQEIALPEIAGVDGNRLWYYAKQIKQSFYDYHKENFEARNVLTGKITDSKAMLVARFPELSGGIGKIKTYINDWLKITSKQGAEYLYSPVTRQLITPIQYNQGRNKNRQKSWQYSWLKIVNPSNTNQSKIVLTQVFRNANRRYNNYHYSNFRAQSLQKNIAQGRVKLVTPIGKACYFLQPEAIYADSTHTIFRYKTEISKQAQYRLACIDRSGNVVWEKGQDDIEVPLLIQLMRNPKTRATFARHKNVLGISSPQIRVIKKNRTRYYQMAVGLDLHTGKVPWKYSPRYYKSRFKKAYK